MSAVEVERTRTGLRDAIADLSRMGREPRVRLALAEAEFRLAIAPGTEPAEAVELLRAAITHDPFQPKLYLHLGRLLHQSGKHLAALSEYRQAVQLAPSSRRAHLLLALALLELDKPEQDLGQTMIKALASGSGEDLRAAVTDLDALFDQRRPGGTTKAASAKKRPRRALSGDADGKPDAAKSTDIWRVALVEQLSRPKPLRAQVAAHLGTGSAQAKNGGGVAEYAIACVLMLINGDSPGDVHKLARSTIAPHLDDPAVRLLDAAIGLVETDDPAEFVTTVTEHLENRVLPPELVCWLHFVKYGPNSALPVADTLRLLDAYPERVSTLDCFQELRLAVLDGHARKAWADERFDEAKLLWRETIPLDPYRVPVAVNLALLAARTKSVEEYGPSWERLVELLYLHAAGAGDVQLFLNDRKTLHLALSQHSRQRHCAPATANATPSDEEIANWLADTDALEVWLREWDLYYLNARLRFRSPTHLLGVPLDAPIDTLAAARDAFVSHVDTALRGQNWAGIGAFCDLAAAKANEAFDLAADLVERGRDLYHELEKAQADALADESLRRGLLLRSMMRVLVEYEAARHIQLGCSIARRQLSLPWDILQPICADRGLIGHDVDLVPIFEADLVSLAVHWDQPKPSSDHEWSRRLVALDECVAVLPHRLELRVLRCRLLNDVGRPADAYSAALEALELPMPSDELDPAHDLRSNLVDLIGAIGYTSIPEALRQPRDIACAERTLVAARDALQRFPHSGTLRVFFVDLLVQLGGEARMTEAVELLTAGIESALNHKQRVEFETQLASTRGAATTDAIRRQVKELAEPAINRVHEAVALHNENPGGEAVQATLEIVREAQKDVSDALTVAELAGLADEVALLRDTLSRLGEIEGQFQRRAE